jgi:hypothetical protein
MTVDLSEFNLTDDERVKERYYDPEKGVVEEWIEAPELPGACTLREVPRDGEVKEYSYSQNWIAEHLRKGEWKRVENVNERGAV